jgi:hypothetical protein
VRLKPKVELTWSGLPPTVVDVYRDGVVIGRVADTNSFTDAFNRSMSGLVSYQVCESGTRNCTNQMTVRF